MIEVEYSNTARLDETNADLRLLKAIGFCFFIPATKVVGCGW